MGGKWKAETIARRAAAKADATQPAQPVEVRPQIKAMAGSSLEDMAKTAPDSTLTALPEEPKRTRRPRNPVDPVLEADPNMADPRYKQAVANMSSLGGKQLIKTGFAATGKPLNPEEENDVDDCMYVISKKGGLNPANNWWLLGLYVFFLLVRLIAVRTELGTQLAGLFDKKPTPKPEAKEEEENDSAPTM